MGAIRKYACELYFEEPEIEEFAERLERLYPDVNVISAFYEMIR